MHINAHLHHAHDQAVLKVPAGGGGGPLQPHRLQPDVQVHLHRGKAGEPHCARRTQKCARTWAATWRLCAGNASTARFAILVNSTNNEAATECAATWSTMLTPSPLLASTAHRRTFISRTQYLSSRTSPASPALGAPGEWGRKDGNSEVTTWGPTGLAGRADAM